MGKVISLFIILLFATFSFAEIIVAEGKIAKNVQNLEPLYDNSTFKKDVGKVYCFTIIKTDKYPTHIVHLWLHNNDIMAEIPLSVNANKWRTYSSKKISPKHTGPWRVEVYSEDGKLIDTIKFEVTNGETKL
jgi:hypothetical protein